MTDTATPEALRLAAWLTEGAWYKMRIGDVEAAGRELRRQHARIAELEAEIAAVAAGGVQALSAAPAEADMFWDAEDGERFGHDIDDIISDYGPGDRVKIDCAKRMPSIEVLVLADDGDLTYRIISPTPPAEQQHPDDTAVGSFAEALKAKLAAARANGRGGWDTPECTQQRLSDMLREHVDKGDPRDVANFCMFLWARGEAIAPPAAQPGAVYAELPDFDSGDEPIWEAIFKWAKATQGSDAHKKADAVSGAVINALRDFADRTHALRTRQAEDSLIKLLAECRAAFPTPEPGSTLEVQWAAAMAHPEEVPEYVRLCVASMQAATTEAVTPKADATTGAASGGVYAETPDPHFGRGRYLGMAIGDAYTVGQLLDFADRTHALRMQAVAAAANAAGMLLIKTAGNTYALVKNSTADASMRPSRDPQAAPEAAPATQDSLTQLVQLSEDADLYADDFAAPKAAPGEPSDAEIDAFFETPVGLEWVIAEEDERFRMLVRAVLKRWAAPQQEAQEPTEIPEEIERMAAGRYKVVPSHESMLHRWAVVAGTGTQQLYLGREVECQNMARKFAGAFLDGAFVAMQQAAPQQEAQEPAGEIVSASCDHATVRWLRQTSSVGGGDPRNSRSWPITGEKVYLTPQPAPAPLSELVKAYCKAWASSFSAANPFHEVALRLEDLAHIEAGIKAVLATQGGKV